MDNGEEVGVPGTKRAGKVDVKWGQIVFFEVRNPHLNVKQLANAVQVQPGRSYHSVEEVIVGDGRQRLGISGW